MSDPSKQTVPAQYLGVMVSSTFTDLPDHRNAVINAINAQGLKPVVMEYGSARPDGDVIDASLQMVRDASAYVGIISHRYGQVPECAERNPQRLSLTELEFNEARRLQRPLLLFIMGDDHYVKANDVETDPDRLEKLRKFRESAKQFRTDSTVHRIYKVFNDIRAFELAATHSVAELRRHLEHAVSLALLPVPATSAHVVRPPAQQDVAPSFDRTPVAGKAIGDLDEAKLAALLDAPLAHDLYRRTSDLYDDKGLGKLAYLEDLGCQVGGRPTVGAILCFGKQDRIGSEHRRCTLQMVDHHGLTRGGPNVAMKLASGNLLSLYEDGMDWLTSGTVLRRERTVGATAADDTEIPRIMLHESLVNALVHRDYERSDLKDQPTRIDVFLDRVEITSYGGLPHGIDIEKLNAPDATLRPFRRNPVIAQLFQCLGLAELNAAGVDRMRRIAEGKHLRPPLFQSEHDYVSIRLFRPTGKAAVFVSSVQHETAAERRAIANLLRSDPLLSQYFEPFLFEEFPVTATSIQATVLSAVERCDVFLLVLGNEYGYESPQGLSSTHLEFERATAAQKVRLVFTKGDKDVRRHPKTASLIRAAREELLIRRFADVPELVNALYASLVAYLAERKVLQSSGPTELRVDHAPCEGASMADISPSLIERFREAAVPRRNFATSEPTQLLHELNLLEAGIPTVAAVLLFGGAPQRYRPGAVVRCVHHRGAEIARDRAELREFQGNIVDQIDESARWVASALRMSRGVNKRKGFLEDEIPAEAFREVIVNAVAHRDYSSQASIQISVLADRIEVWSPGQLPAGLTPADLRQPHPSIPTNPFIAASLALAGHIERAGFGTLTVIAACREAGLGEPLFAQRGNQFVVTLWRPKGPKTSALRTPDGDMGPRRGKRAKKRP